MDRFGSYRNKKNSFVIVADGKQKAEGLRTAKVLLLFWINDRGTMETQKNASLQYMEVTYPIDAVEDTLECVYLR